MIVAFDFDLTLFNTEEGFQIGQPVVAAVEALKRLYNEGHRILIYSGRPASQIIPVLQEHGIPFHKVNEHEGYKTPSGKPYYHVLVDDKNVNPLDKTCEEIYSEIQSLGQLQLSLESLQTPTNEEFVNELDWKRLAAAGAIGLATVTAPIATKSAEAHPIVQVAQDSGIVAKVIAGEAAGEGEAGMQAVACVIQNRMKSGKSAIDIVTKAKQFSAIDNPTMMGRNYRDMKPMADAIASKIGSLADTTGGATHYVTKKFYDKKKNTDHWVSKMQVTKVIGNHVFLKER